MYLFLLLRGREGGREWYCRGAGKGCEILELYGMTCKSSKPNKPQSTGCEVQRFGNLRKQICAGSQGRGTEVLVYTLSAQNSWLLLRITLSHVAMEVSCSPAEGKMENLKNATRHLICLHWIAQ